MPDYGTESDGLDMDMVADFGQGMVNFGGHGDDVKIPVGKLPRRKVC